MLNALVIDDVPQARATLKRDVADYCPEVAIIGEAEGVVSGAKAIREHKPDFVFLDIQMQDGSGFDLLEILGDQAPHIIFTTASDAYAIKAFRISAVDYLLKPIDPDDLMAAVEKVQRKSGNAPESIELLKESMHNKKPITRLALNTLEKIHICNISDIIRMESHANYTMFHFSDKTKIMVTKTLKEYDNLLSEHGFLRVHQSHLVNLNAIKDYIKTDGGYLMMLDGSDIPVSSRKKQAVLSAITDI